MFDYRDDVRSMASAGTFSMVGVYGSVLEGLDRLFNKARFVQGVCVDETLNIVFITDAAMELETFQLYSDALNYLKHASIAAGVLPQSSCSFNPATPAMHCSWSGNFSLSFPLPVMPKLSGR